MRQKLDAVQSDIEALSEDIDKAMADRVQTIAVTKKALDQKIHAAEVKLQAAQKAFSKEKFASSQKIWTDPTTVTLLLKKQDQCQRIVDRLKKAKFLLKNLQDSDVLKHKELSMQKHAITPLWNAIHTKLTDGVALDAADDQKYARIEHCKTLIAALHDEILANGHRMARCHDMAVTYSAGSDQFPSHWLETASVILEQQDFYGFKGTIDHKEQNASKSPSTGLEGYSVACGAILKPWACIRYTLPNTKILIEHDSTGKILDKTDATASHEQKKLAAIKSANLLLLDRALGKGQKIYLRGPKQSCDQAILVVAALLVEAERNKDSMSLDLSDIEVDIIDWQPAMVDQYKASIRAVIAAYHAQDEVKKKLGTIKNEDQMILAHEPIHQVKKT